MLSTVPSKKRKTVAHTEDLSDDEDLVDVSFSAGSPTQSQPTETVVIPDDDGPLEHQRLIADDFSDALKSRTIKVVVRDDHSFFVHEELLCRESDKFQKQLRGHFKEALTGEITDCTEDPTYFFLFLKYLYKGTAAFKQKQKAGAPSQYIIWANLYCMADRLEAKTFQEAVFTTFSDGISSGHPPSKDEICELLVILHTGLPERIRYEYPLRNLVFWYAATKLTSLKQHFISTTNVLAEYPAIATKLLMWASPNVSRKPSFTSDPLEVYFRKQKDSLKKTC